MTLPSILLFHCGDHAVKAVLELAKIVHGHAVSSGDFDSRLPFQGIFAVCGDSTPFEHRAVEDVFDGGIVAGESKAHVNDCGRVGT